jgi:hypothetical protein
MDKVAYPCVNVGLRVAIWRALIGLYREGARGMGLMEAPWSALVSKVLRSVEQL